VHYTSIDDTRFLLFADVDECLYYILSMLIVTMVLWHQVMTDDSGKSRGFGFVGFEDHESAQKVSGGLVFRQRFCLSLCWS